MKLIYQSPIVKFWEEDYSIIEAASDWLTEMTQEEYDAIADQFGRESFDKLNDLFYSFTEFMRNNLDNDDEEDDDDD